MKRSDQRSVFAVFAVLMFWPIGGMVNLLGNPLWMIWCAMGWLAVALAAEWWFFPHKDDVEQDRLRKGLCLRCGYDLRATPDRCPECGSAVSEEVQHLQRLHRPPVGNEPVETAQLQAKKSRFIF